MQDYNRLPMLSLISVRSKFHPILSFTDSYSSLSIAHASTDLRVAAALQGTGDQGTGSLDEALLFCWGQHLCLAKR